MREKCICMRENVCIFFLNVCYGDRWFVIYFVFIIKKIYLIIRNLVVICFLIEM